MFTKVRHWMVLMLVGPIAGFAVMYWLVTCERPGDLQIMAGAFGGFFLVFMVPLKALRGMMGVWRTRRRARIWMEETRQPGRR